METSMQGVKYKPTVKISKGRFWRNSFLYSNVYTKNVKKKKIFQQSPDTIYLKMSGDELKDEVVQQINNCPKVLRKLSQLKYAYKRSRYRDTLSHH